MWGKNNWYCKQCKKQAYNSTPAEHKINELYCAWCDKKEILKDWDTKEANLFEWVEA